MSAHAARSSRGDLPTQVKAGCSDTGCTREVLLRGDDDSLLPTRLTYEFKTFVEPLDQHNRSVREVRRALEPMAWDAAASRDA